MVFRLLKKIKYDHCYLYFNRINSFQKISYASIDKNRCSRNFSYNYIIIHVCKTICVLCGVEMCLSSFFVFPIVVFSLSPDGLYESYRSFY